ncbi:MAG TPA: hypothetical protein DD648_00340 [Candidatus Omnitrophica bacterium]|nr:hypothetical protein [Candidatus Omnitrophota bacterium]
MGKIPVDLNKKETEAGWQQIIDDFALKATPVWFSWVGWLFALSGLQYLYAKGKGILLALLIGFSIGALWIYFQAFFYRIEFRNLPFIRNKKIERTLSLIFSGVLAYVFWRSALIIARIIAENKV